MLANVPADDTKKIRQAIRNALDDRDMTQVELANIMGEREDETSRAIRGNDGDRYDRIRETILRLFNITLENQRGSSMQEIIKINQNEQGEAQVSARELYEALNVSKSTRFSRWFDTNSKQLIENEDYRGVLINTPQNQYGGVQQLQDFSLTVDAAKQMALMSGTEKGREVRMYFIQVEKAWNSPDQIMARALQISKVKLEHKDQLIAEMKPKALFADAVSASQTTILVGELAKLLKQNHVDVGANRLFMWLRENGYLIRRNGTDYNMPTQKSMELGLFEIKEHNHINSNGVNVTTKTSKVTGKGQQYFINKFLKTAQEETR